MIILLWMREEMPTSPLCVEGNPPHTQPLLHIPLSLAILSFSLSTDPDWAPTSALLALSPKLFILLPGLPGEGVWLEKRGR